VVDCRRNFHCSDFDESNIAGQYTQWLGGSGHLNPYFEKKPGL